MDREHYLISKLGSSYIGDDAAIIGDKLYSMDAFFEDVHFKRDWMSMAQIGRKAMLVNISDAIAMCAKPQYALMSISIPENISKMEINELILSMEQTANEYDCEIIGGDTISGDKLHISITIISQSNTPLLRRGLVVGDYLAYTGTLGDSKRDLMKLFSGIDIDSNSKFYEPKLRGDFIYQSRKYLRVGMDISDGLYCDTNKILDANGLGIALEKEIVNEIGSSGEEYEMLIGFDPKNKEKICEIADNLNLAINIFAKISDNDSRFDCINHHK